MIIDAVGYAGSAGSYELGLVGSGASVDTRESSEDQSLVDAGRRGRPILMGEDPHPRRRDIREIRPVSGDIYGLPPGNKTIRKIEGARMGANAKITNRPRSNVANERVVYMACRYPENATPTVKEEGGAASECTVGGTRMDRGRVQLGNACDFPAKWPRAERARFFHRQLRARHQDPPNVQALSCKRQREPAGRPTAIVFNAGLGGYSPVMVCSSLPHMELVACLVVAFVLAMYAVRCFTRIEQSMREQMTRQKLQFEQMRQESEEVTQTIVGEWKASAERLFGRLNAIEHRLAKPQGASRKASEPDTASVGLWANYQSDAGFVQRYTNAMNLARRCFEEALRDFPDLVETFSDSDPWKPGVVVRWLEDAERPFLNEATAWFHGLSVNEKAQWRYRYLSAADQSYEDHWQRARIRFEDELGREVVRLASCPCCPSGVNAAQVTTFVRRAEASALAIQHSGYPNERVPGAVILEALRQPITQFPLEGSVEIKAPNERAVLRAHGNEYGLHLLRHQESKDALLRACAQLFADLGVLNPDAKAAVFQKPREVRMGRRLLLSLDRFHGAPPCPGIGKTEDFDIVDTIATWHFFGSASSGEYEKYQNWKCSRL